VIPVKASGTGEIKKLLYFTGMGQMASGIYLQAERKHVSYLKTRKERAAKPEKTMPETWASTFFRICYF
jgi:hypothetical protein